MFGMPGGWEWLVILIVALLIFGKRLPDVMRSLGKGIVEFKKGVRGIEEDVDKASTEEAKKKLEEETKNKKG
ncbi:MAG: twin-arginine translocase TatA/TatE family subunit [Candidatus Brocadiales bacterium]